MEFFPYSKQSIDENDVQAVSQAITGNLLTRGSHVREFEEAIARYTGASYAVAFSSGSTALICAYKAAGITASDQILSTPNTFIASIAPGTELGATPVFIDIDRKNGNMDLNLVKENIHYQSTRGKLFVVPVHFSGIAVDVPLLDSYIRNEKVIIIEDAAHALGSVYPNGKKIGCCSHSLMTVFSFHPVKQITTGEGGMVTTNDPDIFHKLQVLRNSGIEREQKYLIGKEAPWYYEVQTTSSNYHLNEMEGALGLSQLKRIDRFIAKKRSLVKRYRKNLDGIGGIKLFDAKYDPQTAYHLFVVQIDMEKFGLTKTQLMNTLKDKNIGTQYHYIPLYRMPCYKYMGEISDYFQEMEIYYKQALSFPLYYELSEENVDYICNTLKDILRIS